MARILFRSVTIVSIYVFVSAIITFVLFERTGFYDEAIPWRRAIIGICYQVIGLLLIAFLYKKQCKRLKLSVFRAYSFSKKHVSLELRNIALVTLVAVFAETVAILVTFLFMMLLNLNVDAVNASQKTDFQLLLDHRNSDVIICAINYALTILEVVFVAPLGEEVIFRGILLKQDNAISHFKLLTVASALLFAIVHFDPIWFLQYFATGCVFAYYIFKKRASIITTTISHSILNALSIVVTIV
jgi:membrane protease YdiL (CAAX protease family)